MKRLLLISILFLYSAIAVTSERIVFFSMQSSPENIKKEYIDPCTLIERGSMIKEKYYKIDGERNGRYCSVKIDTASFETHFKFCALSTQQNRPNDARGMCSFKSINGGYSFTAENSEPDSSYRSKYCHFTCLTTANAEPNMTNPSANKPPEENIKEYLKNTQKKYP
jgi:hypothetical protein